MGKPLEGGRFGPDACGQVLRKIVEKHILAHRKSPKEKIRGLKICGFSVGKKCGPGAFYGEAVGRWLSVWESRVTPHDAEGCSSSHAMPSAVR